MRECPRCDRCYEDEVQLCPDDQSNTKFTLPGATLLNARYRLEKQTGRSALGQVYLASDETRRKSVAVKTIRPNVFLDKELDEGEANALFEREVFAPSYAKQGQQFLLQVFAHLPEQAKAAEGLATEFDETSHRRGLRTLEGKVERGSKLTFQLTAPGLIIAEDVQSLIWRASPEPEAVQFRVQVPPDQPTEPIIGTVTVSHQTVPIGHITFKLLIVARDFAAGDAPTREERPWVPYKKAFISYASQDRKEVLKRVQMLDLEGIKFFQDALQMEPGQRWERRLYREIDHCDVFYLFWSTAAKESKWVMQEVQYALERKGNNESAPPAIIPVIIEGPPPVPPPAELAHLHFDHYMIYFMV